MNNDYQSRLIYEHPRLRARCLQVDTPHGAFTTPRFMPVATRAFMNHMTPEDITASGSSIILGGNTYHMLCYPGMAVLEAVGGMHRFMHWHGPMLTDSGGFQVFSLSRQKKLCTITEEGARFSHPVSGEKIWLTPKSSIAAQKIIGADIIMAFDQCTPETGGRAVAVQALERTTRWLQQSVAAHQSNPWSISGHKQALFGIIQGGSHKDLRLAAADIVCSAHCDGIAIGGEVIGFDMQKTQTILDWLHPVLPQDKLRYTMGVGLHPSDLIEVVAAGVDIFDCVAPTRNARHGALYHGRTVQHGDWVTFDPMGEEKGRILIKKSRYKTDDNPLVAGCDCYTCQHYSRAYLHYLFKHGASFYAQLASIHNVAVMQQACSAMAAAMVPGCVK